MTGPEVDPEIEPLLAAASGAPAMHEQTPLEARATSERTALLVGGEPQDVEHVENVDVPGAEGVAPLPLRIYRPAGSHGGVILHLHGGGWVAGSIESHEPTCRALANASGALVVSVAYRLAPEHPFPAALDDARAALRWIGERIDDVGGDPGRVAVMGDSAGGNVATVVARAPEVPLRFQALVYPATDARMGSASYAELGGGEWLLGRADMAWCYDHYLDGHSVEDPDVSPLLCGGGLSASPPALILTAALDPLRDEGEAYGEALRAAGVEVTVRRVPGVVHGFWRMLGVLGAAREAMDEVGTALRGALEGA